MRKKVLKLIGFKEYDPQVKISSNCHEWSIKNCERPGSDVELLKMLFEYAGFDYELIQKDMTSSDEIIEAVANETADMSLLALIISPERLQKVAFTLPINYLQFGYQVKELNALESDQFLLKTFEVNVYLVLICVIAIVAGFTFISYRNYTYKQWLWITFASFFNQANHPKSRKTSFLFLTGAYWFTAFLTICFYQARMKYFLTVPLQKGVDFYNMQELLDQLQYGKWTVYEADNGYSLSQYCRNEQCSRIQMYKKMGKIRYINSSDWYNIANGHPFSITVTAANINLVPNQINVVDPKNKLLFICDNKVSTDMVAFAINKKLTIELELINRAIAQFTSSSDNIRTRYLSPYQKYEINSPKNGAVTLTLLHFNILFFAYIFMIVFAVVIFSVEFLHFRYNWKFGKAWKTTR